MDELLKAALLGVVEGLTEFLPISSTGHLLIASKLLRFGRDAAGTFEIFIQLGAVFALLAYYAGDLLGQAGAVLRGDMPTRRFWLAIAVAFLPAVVAGVLLREFMKAVLFASPSLIALSLIVGGIVFVVLERTPVRSVTTDRAEAISPRQALVVGLAQVVSMVPGVSRSGASIVGGMLAGLDRAAATRFSFYLAIPTLGSATLFELLSERDRLGVGDLPVFAVGTVVAAVVAFLSIGWLLRYVQSNSFVSFGVYRIAIGVVILGLVQAGVL